MNRRNAIVAGILAVSATFFGIAYAQGPGCEAGGKAGFKRSSMQQGGMMDPGARVEQRLSHFKKELGITTQQEPLWQAFAEKSTAEAGKGMQAMRGRAQGEKSLSAPERMAQMQSFMQQRLASMESVNESFTRLYAVLTPEQKQAADQYFSAAGRHSRDSGRGGRGAHGSMEPRKG